MGKRLFVVFRDVLVIFGIASFGVLFHEVVHVVDAVEPYSVCLDFHDSFSLTSSVMSAYYDVSAEPGVWFWVSG